MTEYGSISEIPTAFTNMMVSIGHRSQELEDYYLSNRYNARNPEMNSRKPTEEDKKRMRDYQRSGADYAVCLHRMRLNYSVDNQRNFFERDNRCNKTYVTKSKQTSSFMIGRCPHGIGIFTHICASPESVHDVAQAVQCCFPSPPRYLVYDNACKLNDCIRLREYKFWKPCTIVGDMMHMKGHKCGSTFNCGIYKHGGKVLMSNLNDSATEQGNAFLQSIKLAGTFMSKYLLMTTVRCSLILQRRRIYRKFGRGFNFCPDI